MHRPPCPFPSVLAFFVSLPPLLLVLVQQTHALTYAALGDSYAAGDGAGSPRLPPHPDFGCGRFSHSYPTLISQDPALDLKPLTGFLNLACGGASTASVRTTQTPLLIGRNWDVATVTVGGNEVDFFAVLNACVYGFYPLGNCEEELVRAREHVEGEGFLRGMGNMVEELRERIEGRALVTGYVEFFNDETVWCDDVSLSRREPRVFLTREMRATFNRVVRLLNDVIKASAGVYGAEYVDVNALFEGHRFCEEGGWEVMYSNATWFFQLQPPGVERSSAASDEQQILSGPIDDFLDMTRAFHPTVLGHEAIANRIVNILVSK